MMSPFIYLNEAAEFIPCKDARTVEKWCDEKKLKIFIEEISERKYLIRLQFYYVRLKKFIGYLKFNYKEHWLEAFEIYMSNDFMRLVAFEEGTKLPVLTNKNKYKPEGKEEMEFLSHLTQFLDEQ